MAGRETYGHRGLQVHCICPQGVRTSMLSGSGRAGDVVLQQTAIEPEAVADALSDGMADGRFLILPHPEVGASSTRFGPVTRTSGCTA